jgi:glucosamine-6-phosphate deaminase
MIDGCSRTFQADKASVKVYKSSSQAGRAAGVQGAALLDEIISGQGYARIMVAASNSQFDVMASLVEDRRLKWNSIEVFHMDEYIGLPETHPASFRLWVKTHLVDLVHPAKVHYLRGDAKDLVKECQNYGDLLRSAPIDVCFMGIGDNGHIAFNDPHVAHFDDPLTVKKVELDEKCRLQQVGEGHFTTLDSVPREALTVTIPALVGSKQIICCVPDVRKAEAVRDALEGPISTSCPASIIRTHHRATIFLDTNSASLLSKY